MPGNGLKDVGWALADAAERFGGRPFLCSLETGEALTYADLNAGAARVANLLHALGLSRGARVAVRLDAAPEAACVLFGALRLGVAAVVAAGSRPVGLSTLAARARVAFAAAEEAALGVPPTCRHVVWLGGGGLADERGLDGRALLREAAAEPVAAVREAAPGADCPALIGVGEGREIVLSHGEILSTSLHLIGRHRLRPVESCLGLLPLDGCTGFVAMGLVALLSGTTVWWGPAAGPWMLPSGSRGWAIGRSEALAALALSIHPPRPVFRLALYPADSGRPGQAAQRLARQVEPFDSAALAGATAAPLQVV